MIDRLLELEERGWQALSSPDPATFCEEWLADDAVMVVPGMVIDRITFLQAVVGIPLWSGHLTQAGRPGKESIHHGRFTPAVVAGVQAGRGGVGAFVGPSD